MILRTPQFFAYYSDVTLTDEGRSPGVWHIAITEYVTLVVLRFLAAACDGEVELACLDLLMSGSCYAALVRFLSGVLTEVDELGFLEIIHGCSFDNGAYLLAHRQSSKVAKLIEPG